MNAYEKNLISLGARKKQSIALSSLSVPTDGLFLEAWKFFNSLNFHTPDAYWSETTFSETILNCYPIFVVKTSIKTFEIIGGFRTYSLCLFANLSTVQVTDISDIDVSEQHFVCINSLVTPLLVWGHNSSHTKSDLKRFLKEIRQHYPELNNFNSISKHYAENVSRYAGRRSSYSNSKLAQIIENRTTSEPESDDND